MTIPLRQLVFSRNSIDTIRLIAIVTFMRIYARGQKAREVASEPGMRCWRTGRKSHESKKRFAQGRNTTAGLVEMLDFVTN